MARKITWNGKTQTIPAWAKELGIPESTIRSRLDHLGQSVEQALSAPVDKRFRPGGKRSADAAPAGVPKLTRDGRGRGVARWTIPGGRRASKVFGPWGDPATERAYARWAAEWYAARGRPMSDAGGGSCVADLVLSCLAWAEATFRKHGRRTSEVYGYRAAMAGLNDLYGDTPADEFTPARLRAVQAAWVSAGLAISTCNNYLTKAVQCFSLGVADGLIPACVADALKHVGPLVRGRTKAASADAVRAAPEADVLAVLPHLHADPVRQAVLAAMVRLQLATGMRPGEVCELRPDDIDRSRTPWLYVPASGGKTLHHGKPRRVWLGPDARAILAPWLVAAAPGERLFRFPRRRGRGTVAVTVVYYRDRIADACRIVGVSVFTPHQLRHTAATAIQRIYEDDAAVAAVLGNSKEVARQVYVDDPADAAARRIAEEMG